MLSISAPPCLLSGDTTEISDVFAEVAARLELPAVAALHVAGDACPAVAAVLRPGLAAAYHRQLDALAVPRSRRPADLAELRHLACARRGERRMQEAWRAAEMRIEASFVECPSVFADLRQRFVREYAGCALLPDLGRICRTASDQNALLAHFHRPEALSVHAWPETMQVLASVAPGLRALTLREWETGDGTDPSPALGAEFSALALGSRLTQLTLDLARNAPRPGLLAAVADLPGLTDLTLGNYDLVVTADDEAAMAAIAPRLHGFRAWFVTVDGGLQVAALPFSARLEHLDLYTSCFLAVPHGLRGCTRLQTLALMQASLVDLPEWLTELGSLATLSVRNQLSLGVRPVGDVEGFQVPHWLRQCTSLRDLNLDTRPLVDVAHVAGMGLTSLHLPSMDGPRLAALLPTLPALEVLHMTSSTLDFDPDVLVTIPSLHTLRLSPNRVAEAETAAARHIRERWRAGITDDDQYKFYHRPG